MKSDVFQKLGEEKLATIIGRLMSGESTMTVARIIQEEWGEAQDLSRGALEKELTRLRMSIDRGGLNSDLAEPPLSTSADALQLMPLRELASLVALQTRRIEELVKKEREQGKPLPALAIAMKNCTHMLNTLQTMRFDLGVDLYKRVRLTNQEWQTAQEARARENDERLIEACENLENIFKMRRIKSSGREPQN